MSKSGNIKTHEKLSRLIDHARNNIEKVDIDENPVTYNYGESFGFGDKYYVDNRKPINTFRFIGSPLFKS